MQLSLWAFLLMVFAGGVGAVARWFLDTQLKKFLPELGSLAIINTLGSFLLGVVAALLATTSATSNAAAIETIIGTGFLGGFTTFSTVMVNVAREAMGVRRGGVLMMGTLGILAVACIAFVAGLLVGGA